MALPARVEWAKSHEIQTRRTSMLKAMTLSLAAGALLLGLALTSLTATSAQARARHVEDPINSRVDDPAPRGLAGTECSIKGTFRDSPYCFGSEQTRGSSRISSPIHSRTAY